MAPGERPTTVPGQRPGASGTPGLRRRSRDAPYDPALLDLAALEEKARGLLPPAVVDYYAGGAEAETTLAEATGAWRRWRLRPRVLRGVAAVRLSTSLLGSEVRTPIGVAPWAYQSLAHPDGERGCARGAAAAGALMTVSTSASTPLADVAATEPHSPKWFQLYRLHSPAHTDDLARRAGQVGLPGAGAHRGPARPRPSAARRGEPVRPAGRPAARQPPARGRRPHRHPGLDLRRHRPVRRALRAAGRGQGRPARGRRRALRAGRGVGGLGLHARRPAGRSRGRQRRRAPRDRGRRRRRGRGLRRRRAPLRLRRPDRARARARTPSSWGARPSGDWRREGPTACRASSPDSPPNWRTSSRHRCRTASRLAKISAAHRISASFANSEGCSRNGSDQPDPVALAVDARRRCPGRTSSSSSTIASTRKTRASRRIRRGIGIREMNEHAPARRAAAKIAWRLNRVNADPWMS